MKLSIIIPVYNEAKCIAETLRTVKNVKLPLGVAREIIVIDDCSFDGTRDILKTEFSGDKDIKIYYLPQNSGKGFALREGFKKSTGDIFIIQDGDMEYDPNEYGKLLEPILQGKTDVVYGSRFLGVIKRMRILNRICNKLLNIETNILYGSRITDQATAYKVFRSRVINSISLRCERFEFCPEITAKILKNKFTIYEVPISYSARDARDGKKIKWQDGITAIWSLLKYRFID